MLAQHCVAHLTVIARAIRVVVVVLGLRGVRTLARASSSSSGGEDAQRLEPAAQPAPGANGET
eukprot:12434126-Heterocapsa_arctica.AAC.1